MPLHLVRYHKMPSRAFPTILTYLSLPRNMENSILIRTKEFASTHPRTAREKEKNYDFRPVLSVVIDDQPISDDYVNGERDIGEQDDAVLYDSFPGRRHGRTWKPSNTVNRAACIPDIFLPN